MEWNVTGNVEIDEVDSVNELCVRFIDSQIRINVS